MGTILSGALSPLRAVPSALKASKSAPYSVSAGVIWIKPVRGNWECYTSWDLQMALPPYLDQKGNYTPPMLAKPVGVALSNLPTQLKLSSQTLDVKAMAPRKAPPATGIGQLEFLYLDREKLRHKYYEGAFWQYGEFDPTGDLGDMMFWVCGEIGGVTLDDTQATIELATYEELANRPVGGVYHVLCQVGAEYGEKFGTKRCRNEIMQDGPLRADWTVVATVANPSNQQVLRLEFGEVALSGRAVHPQMHEYLANGDLEFFDETANSLYEVPIRTGALVSHTGGIYTVTVYPKISLPDAPNVGDALHLVAGCKRIKSDCNFFHEGKGPLNMRAQDLEGNSDLQRRTKVT